MRKTTAGILVSFILAIICGVFGQGIADFLNEKFPGIFPIYYLSAVTILSVFLFLISIALTYLQYKKLRMKKEEMVSFSIVIIGFGFLITCWSLFVLAMWWG
ncbi:hypothetical protein NSQ77_11905 [Oceanobacillus sp. FSL K6-2867]|uniref:hypothetical protein n=1 Tax=Oceanobacillus sp. FSL K6-2867 TaxID=2954748 RepID=UPI0030DAE73C